jgi:hypothetical protein
MNLYFPSVRPWALSSMLCDLHVNRSIHEIVQILGKVLVDLKQVSETKLPVLFKTSDDPYVKWAMESRYNFGVLVSMLTHLQGEFYNRTRLSSNYTSFIDEIFAFPIMQELSREIHFNDEGIMQMTSRATLPPLDFPKFYQSYFDHRLSVRQREDEDNDRIQVLPPHWEAFADTHKAYYVLELYPKAWCTWRNGFPDFIATFLRENKSWTELDKKVISEKIKIPRSIDALDAFIDEYDPLPYKLAIKAPEKKVELKEGKSGGFLQASEDADGNFVWLD